MKTFLRFASSVLAIAAAILGLILPRGTITSFVLVLSGLVALLLLGSNFASLKTELAEAKERREAEEAEKAAAKAAEEAAREARRAAMIAEAVKAALNGGSGT